VLPQDFPDWFTVFINEQLAEVPTFNEQPAYDIDNLSITYIRLWSIFETYIKIICKLHEKRSALKEINAKIEQAKHIAKKAKLWIDSAQEVSSAYSASVHSGDIIKIDENVTKFTAQIKSITVTKYSMRKSDIALMKLPDAKAVEKASSEFDLEGSDISHLLHPTNSESKFYKTRNTIAHEGRSDIQLRNFITRRIDPLRNVVNIIEGYTNAI